MFLNLKYHLWVTKHLVRYTVFTTWTLSLTWFIVLASLNWVGSVESLLVVHRFVLPSHHAAIVCVFVVTYAYICCKIRRNNAHQKHHYSVKRRRKRNKANALVPLLLVVTLLVFVVR